MLITVYRRPLAQGGPSEHWSWAAVAFSTEKYAITVQPYYRPRIQVRDPLLHTSWMPWLVTIYSYTMKRDIYANVKRKVWIYR